MKTKTKEKVYAERQHNYKTKRRDFQKALDSVPTTDKKKEEQKKKA